MASAPITPGQVQLVLDVSRLLVVTTDLDLLLQRIAEAAVSLLHCQRATLFLHDPQRGELCSRIALGESDIRLPAAAGIAGECFTTNRPVNVPNAYADPRFLSSIDHATRFTTRNLLAVPLIDVDHHPIGVLEALNKETGFSDTDTALLQLLADQAGVALQRYALQQTALQSESLRREMDLAQRVQQAMIPRHPPVIPGLAAAGWTRPASLTGGDTYDLWTLPDGRLGILVADASGHGLAPALIVSQVRALVRTLTDQADGPEAPYHCPDPQAILTRIHHRLRQDLEPSRFVTAFLGFLSPDGALTWFSAGHGPIFLCPAEGNPLHPHHPHRPPLGTDWELPDLPPLSHDRLPPGGSLVVLTDGLFEAPAPTEELFGDERIQHLLRQHCGDSPAAILACLTAAVRAWEAGQDPRDDQTAVVVQRGP
jgi:serine phosphatase RsbU (regulator of sigma subunit)